MIDEKWLMIDEMKQILLTFEWLTPKYLEY